MFNWPVNIRQAHLRQQPLPDVERSLGCSCRSRREYEDSASGRISRRRWNTRGCCHFRETQNFLWPTAHGLRIRYQRATLQAQSKSASFFRVEAAVQHANPRAAILGRQQRYDQLDRVSGVEIHGGAGKGPGIAAKCSGYLLRLPFRIAEGNSSPGRRPVEVFHAHS